MSGPGPSAVGQGDVDLGIEGIADAVRVGQGSFGTVYRATQTAYRRSVAVKVLTTPLVDEANRRSFERECQALGALADHPHIVTLYAAGVSAESRPYLIMEFLPGGSLGDRLADGPLAWEEAVAIGVKVAGALATAHSAGVLHRDIKPENVLVSAYDEPQLADFGVAKVQGGTSTTMGMITGSVAHAAPEVLSGVPATEASDVWSLASTVATLLAGAPPFHRDGDESLHPLLMRIITAEPNDLRPLGVPDEVCQVIGAGLAKNSWERTPTAIAFGEALQRVQRQLRLPATPMTVRRPSDEATTGASSDAAVVRPPGADTAPPFDLPAAASASTLNETAAGATATRRRINSPVEDPSESTMTTASDVDLPPPGPERHDQRIAGRKRRLAARGAVVAVVAVVALVTALILGHGSSGKSRAGSGRVPSTGATLPGAGGAPLSTTSSTSTVRAAFVDDFTNPSSGWAPDAGQDGNGMASYEGDGYHVTVLQRLPSLNTYSVASPYQPRLYALSVSVTAAMLSGAPADGPGVRCDQGVRAHLRYSFEIHGDGSWVVFKLDDQGKTALLQGQSPVINTGSKSNVITGTCTEVGVGATTLTMVVNGVTLGSASDPHPGRIAWHAALVVYRSTVAQSTEIRFTSFRAVDNGG